MQLNANGANGNKVIVTYTDPLTILEIMTKISFEFIHTVHIDNPPRQLVLFVTSPISEAKFSGI